MPVSTDKIRCCIVLFRMGRVAYRAIIKISVYLLSNSEAGVSVILNKTIWMTGNRVIFFR